jgi:amino-acid N-acetyltransferase
MGEIRKPNLSDVPAIKQLIDDAVAQGSVLPRELAELYESIRDFYIYVDDAGVVVGCVALHIDMADLAEIRSLVVVESMRGLNIGYELAKAAVREAESLNIARVYALTRVPEFFTKSEFYEVEHHVLPHKVFKDCIRCRLFPGCDEIAMVRDLPTRQEGFALGEAMASMNSEGSGT